MQSKRNVPRPVHRAMTISVVLTALLLAGCSSGSSSGTGSASGDEQGAALYKQSCGSCHGDDLRGTDRGPSQLSQVYAPDHHPDAAYRSAIENGAVAHHWNFGDMAPVKGLSSSEIDEIIAYIRQQQQEQGFEAYPPG